jgi:hypothetical protein
MSTAAKRARSPRKATLAWRSLKSPFPEQRPQKNESSRNILPSEEDPTTWHPVKRRSSPEKLVLLRLVGGVCTFQDSANDWLYRREIDSDGSERWSFQVSRKEREWISQSDAARLIGVSREAIRKAIVYKRLGTVECNGHPRVSRADVLALKIQGRARKQ